MKYLEDIVEEKALAIKDCLCEIITSPEYDNYVHMFDMNVDKDLENTIWKAFSKSKHKFRISVKTIGH